MSRLTLAADPAAVREARRFARACCVDADIAQDVTETVVLLMSEAVTNAFVHGRSDARLTVTVARGAVLVEVRDDNSRHPKPVEADNDALDGRGMILMEALAQRWGVRDEEFGKTVWFQVSREPITTSDGF